MAQGGGEEMLQNRGKSWRDPEIRDLLNIWGDSRVQESLRMSHRNLEVFTNISREMRERGHHRSPTECRAKTKSLRLEYRKVLAHNRLTGVEPVTCPYYRELNLILSGDASVGPKRISRNIKLVPERERPASPTPGSSDQVEEDLPISLDPTPPQERPCDLQSEVPESQEIPQDDSIVQASQEAAPDSPPPLTSTQRDTSFPLTPSRMTPRSRFRMARNRTNRGSRAESASVALMHHQTEENRIFREQQRREHEESLLELREATSAYRCDSDRNMQCMRELIAELAENRREIRRLGEYLRPDVAGSSLENRPHTIVTAARDLVSINAPVYTVAEIHSEIPCSGGDLALSQADYALETIDFECLLPDSNPVACPAVNENVSERPRRTSKRKTPYSP